MNIFILFGELRKKWPKNAQSSLKSSKNAVYRLLVKEKPKETNRIASNQKLINDRSENEQ